ncbi:hypothetical protein C1M51_02815 [Methylibium sp. Pch-M]|uniref:phage capsid protein n=1 Tax=Methylibium sp. Pch-M TaxID=2082386 RepID=UPI0010109D29|nr:phage capsid protein [Methylibium sp. Pch-M]QAZ38437.1 hypothetical protein C1M51_02815 [Methylibium sp. Pch-M]
MSANSPAFYSVQYASAVELLAQQLQPKVASLFTPMTGEGKSATVVNQIGSVEADERTTRYDDITPGDPLHTRPWVYPRHFDKAVFFDTLDQMQMNANPQSEYVQAIVAAIHRKMDDEAIRAFFAARNVGETGGSSENFNANSNRQVGVSVGGTTSGLNVEKLQTAIRIFEEAEVDPEVEQIYCAISPKQKVNLMNEIEITSGDFFKAEVMRTRNVNGFLSINFVVSNRLPVDGSGYRRVPFWTRKGMTFCSWGGGMKTDVSQRKDKRGMPWQAYAEGHFGAVRRDSDRVLEILCSEA